MNHIGEVSDSDIDQVDDQDEDSTLDIINDDENELLQDNISEVIGHVKFLRKSPGLKVKGDFKLELKLILDI